MPKKTDPYSLKTKGDDSGKLSQIDAFPHLTYTIRLIKLNQSN